MTKAVAERESLASRLAEEEKLAQLGRLASGMAHEVNNPLGGMRTALATLRRHGSNPEVRATALDLLDRGLEGIRNVVRATLVTYKDEPNADRLVPADLDDLRYLIQHEVSRRQLRVTWINHLRSSVEVERSNLRQALLNLLLNACAASPIRGEVGFEAAVVAGNLEIVITDTGPGLPRIFASMLEQPDAILVPPEGGGLGLWTSARLIKKASGRFKVDYPEHGGARISLSMPATREALDDVA